MDDSTRMPFDQYQRYRLVADVLANVRPDETPLEVLDVGGRTALLRRFLPNDRVEMVDVEASEEEGLVIGSGAALPFQDKAFDAVVCFDTLEHVPPDLRDAFVDECARVAKRWVVIAGPYHTPEVARSEELLQEFLHEKLGEKHRYLEEHRTYGLPDRKDTEARLRDAGARVRSIGHARLDRWLGLMCLSLYMDRDSALRGIAGGFHQFYNEALYASDHAKPVYRHAVVAAFGKAKLPKADELLGPEVAPKGSLKPVDHLVRELLSFDSQRDVVRAEWERLESVNRGLEKDLQEHRASLEEARADLADHKRTLGEMRREHEESLAARDAVIEAKDAGLAELLQRLAETQAAAEITGATLQGNLKEASEEAEVLRRDLAEHAETLRAQREELEAKAAGIAQLEAELERERAASAAQTEHLTQELEHHRTSLGELGRLRGELESVVKELEAIVADKDKAIADVHAELERERKDGGRTIEVLTRDLDAHRKHAAALEAERDDFQQEVSRLLGLLRAERIKAREREKSAHAGLELHQEVMREQDELYQDQRSDAQALEEDLGEHRAVLERLRAELEETLTSRETREEQLRREIDRHNAAVSALTTHLEEAQANLEREREALAKLRAEMNSRWQSLLRAVAPRREDDESRQQ